MAVKLGRYEIRSELGRGAMGRVLLGHDPEIDRRVAIKIVQGLPELDGEDREAARRRFLGEARAAGKLLHPGIVTLFDVGELDGAPYLAMELVEGQTLERFCQPDKLLPVPVVLELVAAAAEALAYAHAAGIVHGDVKPANLMRTGETTLKIMDFGLARGAGATHGGNGALVGTPAYMAPEQIRGQAVDGRADLFSLGAVLYELLTGVRPFAGDTVTSVIYRLVHEEPRAAAAVTTRVDGELSSLVRRALAKDPRERFQSGTDFAAALRHVAARMPAPRRASGGRPSPASRRPPADDPGPAHATRPARSSAAPFVIVIALVVAAAGAGAFFFRTELGISRWFERAPVVYETRVRVEPPEAEVRLDGAPLGPEARDAVRFGEAAPLLTAELGCRREERRLGPGDAGGEVAIVLEPVRMEQLVEPPVAAALSLNGEPLGRSPLEVPLDLCRANRLTLSAPGYRETNVDIPEGATPLEARGLLQAATLSATPRGRLVLPSSQMKLAYFVDGKRVDASARTVELTEGKHELRVTNEAYWLDETREVEIAADADVEPELALPGLATLVVFAHPPNAKVELRRPGGTWQYLDDVPVRREIAAGRYEVKVTLNATGESRTREVELEPGTNPEVRISFGSST
jgi:serine/threonine-protein kinase